MLDKIREILEKEYINTVSPIRLSDCKITRPYLLEREGIGSGTAIMIAAPYYTEACIGASVSAYAVSRDYHLFYRELFERVLPLLRAEFPQNKFCGFADHSPIDERDAALRAGLGVMGKNGLLITEKYSSFVFIGELICDAELPCELHEPSNCFSCGLCLNACPMTDTRACLSAVTQKKGVLTEDEAAYIRENGYAWGCDICQNVCPYTEQAIKNGSIFTPIPFFKERSIPHPTVRSVEQMSDGEFAERAFSWRGRECILRNLHLLGKN